MTIAIAVAIPLVIVAPHLFSQSRLPAGAGIAMWLANLALRAVLALSLATVALVLLPATELFRVLTSWCLHGVLPFVATHLGLEGHSFGDAAVLAPSLLIVGFTLSAVFGVWRATWAVRTWLGRNSLGSGPGRSLIVGGSEVLVAAAGLRDPLVVVSAGALLRLDDAELAAGLEHERGHIAHRHRFIALFGQLFYGFSRLLPGGRRALNLLHFQLEREADEYAVQRTGDSLALAGAISKAAAATAPAPSPALAHLGARGVPERLRLLLRGAESIGRLPGLLARVCAVSAVALALGLAAGLPVLASIDPPSVAKAGAGRTLDCPK